MRRSAHARGIDRPSSSTGDRVAGNRNAKAGARVSAGNDMLGPSCDVQKDNGLSPQATVVSVGCERSACDRVMQVHQLDSCQCAAYNSDNTTTGDMVDPTARFADAIGGAYEQVIHWRRNLFNVPYGAAGADFIDEVSALLRGFADGNRLRAIAWKALCVACHVLLQKPHASCSSAAFSQHLSRRLLLWKAGKVSDLLEESMCIQTHLPDATERRQTVSSSKPGLSDTLFSRLVFSGKINSAMRYISQDGAGGVLRIDDKISPASCQTVRDVLLSKHPPAAVPPQQALLDGAPGHINPIVFEQLTPKLIKDVGRRAKGAAGPSGLDAEAWKRMLTCFKQSSDRLCAALSAVARCLCVEDLSETDLSAFTAARLIPLDKKPGVRPIAVGEVVRRIVCKAIMKIIERDVLLVTAPRQVCVGVPSACEAAVHAMDGLFRQPDVEGILLVDASNAFNSLNRTAALHNIPRLCPALGRVFTNTYSKPVRLFVSGGGEILSEEGTCQGDPLAMAAYAVAMTPLIRQLDKACPSTAQCWYADDDGAADNLVSLRKYWDYLSRFGPGFGYFPNAIKTVLLTKPALSERAGQLFAGTGIDVRYDGCRYLGGALGQPEFCQAFMATMAEKWCWQLMLLSELAQTQPHAAYALFTKGLSSQWRYHIRVTECPPETFLVLDQLINEQLLPALTGHEFSSSGSQRTLFSLPAGLGGLALPVVSELVPDEYISSKNSTAPLRELIAAKPEEGVSSQPSAVSTGQSSGLQPAVSDPPINPSFSTLPDHTRLCPMVRPATNTLSPVVSAVVSCHRRLQEERVRRRKHQREVVKSLEPLVSREQQFLLSIAAEKGVSSWLTAEPSFSNGTVLNKSDFKDALCLRYGFSLDGLATACVCGADLTVDHALTCPSGGYPTARHNEVRDFLADVLRSVCADVEVEPQLLCYNDETLAGRTANRSSEARLDIRARGFWSRQQEAFFDIRVTHPKADLLSVTKAKEHLAANEREKKRQYGERVNTIERGSFTPLVFSTSGMVGRECGRFLKDLVAAIVDRNSDLQYAHVMNILRCKLAFCLLRWNVTCMRGCRASYKKHRASNFTTQCRLTAPGLM